jgi:N6-adenosine-specific RNA methylase IME4
MMQTTPLFPHGPFDVIYADPPWKYDYALPSEGQNIDGRHYTTMPVADICSLPVSQIAAEHSVLFLWATPPKMLEALAVMKAWGFSYRQQLIWEKLTPTGKQNHGMGHWFKCNHELVLFGIRGAPRTPPDRKMRPHSVFRAPRRGHSRKPDEVYGFIEGMFPHLPRRIELFARGKGRDGWEVWGDESE